MATHANMLPTFPTKVFFFQDKILSCCLQLFLFQILLKDSYGVIMQQNSRGCFFLLGLSRDKTLSCCLKVALDFCEEKAKEKDVDLPHSAVQYVKKELNMNICAIATLTDLLSYLESTQDPEIKPFLDRVKTYRERYGVDAI